MRHVQSLCQHGRLKEALQILDHMEQAQPAYLESCVCFLRGCTRTKALEEGRKGHARLTKGPLVPNTFMFNTVINMYAKCGSMEDARLVFDSMHEKNVFTWTMIIVACAQHGNGRDALRFFHQMLLQKVEPNFVTFVGILNACTGISALAHGKKIHATMVKSQCNLNKFAASAIIDMYAKCGCIVDARRAFDTLASLGVVSWNAMIVGYIENNSENEAIQFYGKMQQEGEEPDKVSFTAVLNGCASLTILGMGKHVHASILKCKCKIDIYVGNSLIDMYLKCASLKDAQQVFETMVVRDVVSWNTMLVGVGKHGTDVLQFFGKMQLEGVDPDKITYLNILSSASSLEAGKYMHASTLKTECELDITVGNSILGMYAKHKGLDCASVLFDRLPIRKVLTWTTMVAGYAQHGDGKGALKLFSKMQDEAVQANEVTYVNLLNACASILFLEQGKYIHALILRYGSESNISLGTNLIDFYVKCGSLICAYQLFDRLPLRDTASWNALIGGYAICGHLKEIFQLFGQMKKENTKTDNITFISLLGACSAAASLALGKWVHAYIIHLRDEVNIIAGNTLIDMYVKCSFLGVAHQVFSTLPAVNAASWNALIVGYKRHWCGREAFRLYKSMDDTGTRPDKVTFVNILNENMNLYQVKHIHAGILKSGYAKDCSVGNSLVNIYAKLLALCDACQVFDSLPVRDVISWSQVIAALVEFGNNTKALQAFEKMQLEFVQPDSITYVSILRACASMTMSEMGKRVHTEVLRTGYGADMFVASATVDMYAKCGMLDTACNVFNILAAHDAVLWNAVIMTYAQHGRAKEAISLSYGMQMEGIRLDEVAFTSLLFACSHACLVDEGSYLLLLITEYGLTPIVQHYTCFIDVIHRAGNVVVAEDIMNTMPFDVTWMPFSSDLQIIAYISNSRISSR